MKKIIHKIYEQAQAIGCCDLFKGSEDLEGIINLFKSPQGLEFCIKHHFPRLATLQLFKRCEVEKHGIYIDAGEITLTNPGKVLLIGHTTANIICTETQRNEVILMHGATAVVNASGWSVTFVKVERGSYIKNSKEHALIL